METEDKLILLGILSEEVRKTRLMEKFFEIKGLSADCIGDIHKECNEELIKACEKATGIKPEVILKSLVGL